MPKKFCDCVARGGKVRTKKIGTNKYIRLCVPKSGGKAVYSHIKTKKKR